jgi:hypothetical protein
MVGGGAKGVGIAEHAAARGYQVALREQSNWRKGTSNRSIKPGHSRPGLRPMNTIHPLIAEFIGTAILVTFGNGVVANVVLSKTKGNGSGWIVITADWALAVFVGVLVSPARSGGI